MRKIFGIPESQKEKRQRRSRENRRKGKASEQIIKERYRLLGYEVERTGHGSDFHVRKRDILGKVVDSKDIEVKTGDPTLSELQQETKKRKKGRYKVERIDPPPFFYKDL